MAGRPFEDASTSPTEDALRAALGPAFTPYSELAALTDMFRRDWTFSKGSGWMLKVHDRSKALLYVIPLGGSFRLSMAIREDERDVLLADGELGSLRGLLAAARRFSEGFSLQLDVCSTAELAAIEPFLTKLMAMRGSPPR